MAYQDLNTYELYYQENALGKITHSSIALGYKIGKLILYDSFSGCYGFLCDYAISYETIVEEGQPWNIWEKELERLEKKYTADMINDQYWYLINTNTKEYLAIHIPIIEAETENIYNISWRPKSKF